MNKVWLKAAGMRAIKTMAQTAIGSIGTTAVGLSDVNWVACVSTCITTGILSLLFSIKGLPEVKMEEELNKREEDQKNG